MVLWLPWSGFNVAAEEPGISYCAPVRKRSSRSRMAAAQAFGHTLPLADKCFRISIVWSESLEVSLVVESKCLKLDYKAVRTYLIAAWRDTSFSAAANKMRKPLIQTVQVKKGQARKCGIAASGVIDGSSISRVDCMMRCSSLTIDLDALIQVCKAAPYSGLDFGAVSSGRFRDMMISCLRTLSVECWERLKTGA